MMVWQAGAVAEAPMSANFGTVFSHRRLGFPVFTFPQKPLLRPLNNEAAFQAPAIAG